jgi:hypothetical protein
MRSLALSILVSLFFVTPADAQENPMGFAEFNAFVDKPQEGWEWDNDERLDDLLMQLQEKELALQAVDLRTAKLQGKKVSAKMDESMAWRRIDRMDLNAGGPMRWDAFYGKNAENFFYHPVDRNTTYHTITVLQQVQPTSANGVPGNQGVPAHQRPPQFDYIYRGYERRQAKAKEEANEITNKLETLQDRRKQLEEEVVLLWTKIAFRVLDREKVAEKPVLRWASLPVDGGDKEDSERAIAFNEAARLLAIGLLFNEQRVESEAEKVFSTVSTAIQKNRRNFEDSLLRAGVLLDDSEDKTKPIGQYKFLSRKLEDTAKSLSEGYRGWKDGDENDDEPTKFVGLRRVQDSVVTYAKILLALNELVDVMKKDWGLRVNTDSTEFVPKWDVAYEGSGIKDLAAREPRASNAWPPLGTYAYKQSGGWTTVITLLEDGVIRCEGRKGTWVLVGGGGVRITFWNRRWIEVRKGRVPGVLFAYRTHDGGTGEMRLEPAPVKAE